MNLTALRITRPSPALVVATLALIIAIGGTSYAAITVSGANVRNNSIASIDLTDNSIVSRDIRNGSIYPVDLSAAAKRSMQGAPGPVGPVGPAGATGPTGATGATGPAGPTASAFEMTDVTRQLDTSYDTLEFAVITVSAPSRLIATGSVVLGSSGLLAGGCRLLHAPVGGATQTAISPVVSTTAADAANIPVTVLGSIDVPAGQHGIYLQCFEVLSQVTAYDPAITVIATGV